MNGDVATLIAIGIEGLFYILLFIFTIHTVFLGYHWFTYGNNRRISTIALATYLAGGAVLFMTLAFSLSLL